MIDVLNRYKWWILAAIVFPLLMTGVAFSHPYWPSNIEAREVDFASLNETLGIWDGEKTTFSTKYVPKPESLQIYLDGRPIALTIKHSIDGTGNITFVTSLPKGTVISAAYTHSQETKEG